MSGCQRGNGNEIGCKDSEQWCEDPRCYPDCPDCTNKHNRDRIIIIVALIIVVILLVFDIGWIVYDWNKKIIPHDFSIQNLEYEF